MKKVILVTGASSGFGRLMADALAGAGHVVYASSDGSTVSYAVIDRVREEFLRRIGFAGLLHPTAQAKA